MTQDPAAPADAQLAAMPADPPTTPTDPDGAPTDLGTTPGGTGTTPGGTGTTPAVVAVTVLGTVVTGLFLVTADRWGDSGAGRVLGVVALVTALTAVLAAVTGQLLATLGWPAVAGPTPSPGRVRRGSVMILLAGALSVVALLTAGAAALTAGWGGTAGGGTEPTVTVQMAGGSAARTVSAVLSFPGLPADGVLDATLTTLDDNGTLDENGIPVGGPVLLARALVRPGEDGPAVAQLAATLDPNYRNVIVTATAGSRTCTATLPTEPTTAPVLTCRD